MSSGQKDFAFPKNGMLVFYGTGKEEESQQPTRYSAYSAGKENASHSTTVVRRLGTVLSLFVCRYGVPYGSYRV